VPKFHNAGGVEGMRPNVSLRRACVLYAGAFALFVSSISAAPVEAAKPAGAGTDTTPINVCSSGFDSNNENPTYLQLLADDLPKRAKQCADAITRLRRFIRQSSNAIAFCSNADGLIAGKPQKTGKDADDLKALQNYLIVLAVRLDHDCVPLLSEALSYQNQPAQLLFTADRPTAYVLMAAGGPGTSSTGSSGGSSGSGGSGKSGGGGGGGGGGSATSSVDSPSGLLLFMIAQRLQNSVCRVNDLFHSNSTDASETPDSRTGSYVDGTIPTPAMRDNRPGRAPETSGPCNFNRIASASPPATSRYSVPPLAVVPEGQWTIEDFRNQCVGDPYIDDTTDGTSHPHGTVAGIILNGAITTRDGAFHFFALGGGSEAEFGAEVVTCGTPRETPGPPNNVSVWSDLISSGTRTERLSMFPFALTGAIIAANLTAKASYNQNPTTAGAPTGASLAAAQAAFQQTNTSLSVGQAIGSFAQGLTQLTFGNPSSALTLRKTFDKWASEFNEHLVVFCTIKAKAAASGAKGNDLCGYLTTPKH
jgi:hypothetical protein